MDADDDSRHVFLTLKRSYSYGPESVIDLCKDRPMPNDNERQAPRHLLSVYKGVEKQASGRQAKRTRFLKARHVSKCEHFRRAGNAV